jgi:putative serine protease PepD
VSDGSAWRRPGEGRPDTGRPGTGDPSPWWSDAPADPWRDPAAPAVVLHTYGQDESQAPLEPPEPAPARRAGAPLFLVVVVALLAGALGGTFGFIVAASHGGFRPSTTLGASSTGTAALAQRSPTSVAAVVRRILPSVVTVQVSGPDGTSLGSGFIVSPDGYLITNDHVVSGATDAIKVTFSDSSTAVARVVGTDPESDVAVLRANRSGLTPVEFADSDRVAVGDPVLAIGAPLALSNTVTSGIVSALDRTIEAGENGGPTRYYAAIQTDAAVNHGNSGGPLVDAAGRVIGVNSVIKSVATNEDEAGNIGLAFAVPINQAKRVAQDIIDTGRARRTVLGAELENSYRSSDGGVRLASVVSGGPAEHAGLRAGDIVTRIGGHPLADPSDLIAMVRKYAPGSRVAVEYRRGGGGESRTEVTLAADVK